MTARDVQSGIESEYSLDNTWVQARERLAALEALVDPSTIRHLEALGVSEGWQCLEVGGGGGSITEWLCRRVGPAGRVVARRNAHPKLAAHLGHSSSNPPVFGLGLTVIVCVRLLQPLPVEFDAPPSGTKEVG
jgi:hypothetical protein